MKFGLKILILLQLVLIVVIFSVSCKSPLDVDATRDKDTIFDPDKQPAVIQLDKEFIDLGIILPDEIVDTNFRITNISNKNIQITKISNQNTDFNLMPSFTEFELKSIPKESKDLGIRFIANNNGLNKDTFIINDYKKPKLIIHSSVAEIYGRDLEFENTKVGSLSGRVLKIYNDTDEDVIINTFEITENNSIFFEETSKVPFEIKSKSFENIVINFNPTQAITYQSKILLKTSGNFIVDTLVNLKGKGLN